MPWDDEPCSVLQPVTLLSFVFCLFRIAVFSVPVLHDDRIVLVAEQRPDASEEDSFQWMSRVLQVVTLSFSLSR